MIVISPHLDDAVWSASATLEDSTVVTVCAGLPSTTTPPSLFDKRAGFDSARKAMEARRSEDRDAAAVGGFEVVHLDWLDNAYTDGSEPLEDVVRSIARDAGSERIVGPWGLAHPDHAKVAAGLPDDAWRYEELPYAYLFPIRGGPQPEVVDPAPWKEEAVRCYRSQVTDQTHLREILTSERFHR